MSISNNFSYIDKDFDTADEFIDFFRKHHWLKTTQEHLAFYDGINGFIFRGQSNKDWKLVPSAFRGNTLITYTQQTAGDAQPDRKNRPMWLGWHLHSELRAVNLFLEAADRLGIPNPIDYTSNKEHQDLLVSALNNQETELYKSPFPCNRILNELALAQHHGVPTRLIDWTESPFIAAFFAAYEASIFKADQQRTKSERIAVLMLRTHELRKHSDHLTIVKAPRHANWFLRTQKGLFTHMPKANKYYLEKGSWPSIEDIVNNIPELEPCLTRVSLPASKADDLLRVLYDMDITRHSLMPSLDNAAQACEYTLKLYRNYSLDRSIRI